MKNFYDGISMMLFMGLVFSHLLHGDIPLKENHALKVQHHAPLYKRVQQKPDHHKSAPAQKLFQTLPPEVILHVASFLETQEAINLSSTCGSLRSLLKPKLTPFLDLPPLIFKNKRSHAQSLVTYYVFKETPQSFIFTLTHRNITSLIKNIPEEILVTMADCLVQWRMRGLIASKKTYYKYIFFLRDLLYLSHEGYLEIFCEHAPLLAFDRMSMDHIRYVTKLFMTYPHRTASQEEKRIRRDHIQTYAPFFSQVLHDIEKKRALCDEEILDLHIEQWRGFQKKLKKPSSLTLSKNS